MDITVRLEKQPNQSIGIGFKKLPKPPFCQVFKLVQNGAAFQSGKVSEGDMLLSVNGHNVTHLSPDGVRDILSRFSNNTELLLELRRPTSEIPNGVVPAINCPTPTSPELPSMEVINGSDSSPETSPQISTHNRSPRTRRSGLHDRGVTFAKNALPGIQEGALSATPSPGLFPAVEKKRHSLTPELTRRTHIMNQLKSTKSLDLANLPQWRQATEQITVQNLIDGTELYDRLHNQELKVC